MKRTITLIILSLYGFAASSSYAVVVSGGNPEEAQVIEELLDAPAVSMRFQNASLPSVLRALAETAGMPFIGLPRGEAEDIYVDMTVKGNAYASLEQVAETYGYALVYQKGVWLFRPIKQVQSKLVSKVYKLKHIHLSSVSPDQQAISTAQGSDNSSARPDSINTTVFSTSENKVVEDIKMILSINPGDLSPNVTQTAEADVPAKAAASTGKPTGLADMLMGTSPEDLGRKFTETLGAATTNMLAKSSEETKVARGAVISNPDNNSVFVVATSAQHEWIQAYLEAIDQPRKLILLETRFVEIRKEPSVDMGVDWDSVLSGEYNITATDHSSSDSDSDSTAFFFKDSIGGSILSGPELTVALSFLRNFADSRNLQHPSQVTVNNRSVVLRSVRQVPYQSSSSTNNNSGSVSSTNNIQYMPIGTTISILPRILDGDNIELNLLMNVSDLLGYSDVGSDVDIPLTSSRDYSGEAIVKTGNTLAIAGLEALLESDNESKVPILGDIPFFGYLFKSSSKTQNNYQLIMFVTATIMDGYEGGITPKKDLQEAVDYFDGLERMEDATKHVDEVLGSPRK